MKILAHRGLWQTAREKNTLPALTRAFDAGFGVETDVRDCAGRLVISHDPPNGDETELDILLAALAGRPLPLALNIKADGLARALAAACAHAHVRQWFVFDMSVPDMREQLATGNPVYGRRSETETSVHWEGKISGIWLDAFEGQWYSEEVLSLLLAQHTVCVVSAELHGRDTTAQWRLIQAFAAHENLLLCTDTPLKARSFFCQEMHT